MGTQIKEKKNKSPKKSEIAKNAAHKESDVQRTETLDCVKQSIEEYLVRHGFMNEKELPEKAADKARTQRYQNYRNVKSLLENYRALNKTYDVFKMEFGERISEQTNAKIDPKSSAGFFDQIAQQLELLSVTEERKFERQYVPQIQYGRRVETAIKSLTLALKVLKAQDKELYKIISIYYIDGDKRPNIREIMEKMGYTAATSFYRKREEGEKKLTNALFGFSPNQAELIDILVLLRQQNEDDCFTIGNPFGD